MDDTFDEQIIESESPEIHVGENIGWGTRIKSALPAFKSMNYRLYFGGQIISTYVHEKNISSWQSTLHFVSGAPDLHNKRLGRTVFPS